MNTNLNNTFITTVTRPSNVHVLENDFHLYGCSDGNNKNLSGVYMVFPVSMVIILFFR